MAYEKQTWVDGVTPLDAEHLNHMEQGIFNANGTSGEAGGYYAPAVDAEGNLTWAASKADMPAVDGANIKGPKGDTGAQGPQGEKGDTGATGATGPAGANGKSAYAYAVEGGYTGAEAQFAEKLAQETYSRTEIDNIMGSYINDIDSLIGGDS